MNDRKQDAETYIDIVRCARCNCIQTRICITATTYFVCVKCKSPVWVFVSDVKDEGEVRIIPNGKVGQ